MLATCSSIVQGIYYNVDARFAVLLSLIIVRLFNANDTLIDHISNQCSIQTKCSFSSLEAVWEFFMVANIAVSSVKVDVMTFLEVGRSLIYNNSRVGPKSFPCGTPALTSQRMDVESL